MKRGVVWTASALGGLVLGGMSLMAQAATLSFDCITSNDIGGASCASGSAQLSVAVSDIGGGEVLFWFTNSGLDALSITDVYFDDDESSRYLSAITGLIDADEGTGGSSGVDFSLNASPKELPGANNATPAFQTTQGLSTDSDSPVAPKGVNPGEYLGIVFSLQDDRAYADVLSGLASGALRVGMHVQGFNGGFSEGFVNTPYAVPVPAAAWLFGSGLAGIVTVGRRRNV